VRRYNVIAIWDRIGLASIVFASWVIFALFAHGFTSQFNIYSVGRLTSILIVVGLAQMVVIGIAGMNLAVGAIGGVVAMFLGWLMQQFGIPWPIAMVLAVAFGGVLGAINGILIVKTGISGFVITLGTAGVFSGAMYIITKVEAFRDLPQGFLDFGKLKIFGLVSPLVFIMVGVVALLYVGYRTTTFGRQMLAVGANVRAARVSGVPVERIILLTHVLSGALAGLAGVMLVARIGSAIPSIGTAGGGDWLLPSFAAPAIGGTLLAGGVVNVLGTFFGGLLLGTIENGLTLLDVPSFWVQLLTGLVLLAAVILDRVRSVAVERSRIGVNE
jgi:ribose transport system permease protein